ncbi:uncharacterized protein [Ptychodera flava]|uniref:uncharacterized protein n=1 Tax=Ptychodera flava TaxID=63121 RepID=UPI00396A7297
MNISLESFGLNLSRGDPVYKLITTTPDMTRNPVGTVARAALVNKMISCTPGQHTEGWPQPAGQTFRQIFFPNYSSVVYEGDVNSVTGQSDNFWSDFSVAVLCQSMYYQTSDIRQQLEIAKINESVNSSNNTLQGHLTNWYTYVMFHNFMNYHGDLEDAKKVYINQINNTVWVTYKMKQYNDGTWDNPDWELFHHWVKLSALGASVDEIANVINSLKGKGLYVYPNVDVGTWQQYVVWYSPGSINHNDIDQSARDGELATVSTPVMGSPMSSSMAEENCFEFTADSQPGNSYRELPSSCCFSSNTKILMSDGSLKEIQHVVPGETVRTPTGDRKVLIMSRPHRRDRVLYGANSLNFQFTDGHPFVSSEHGSMKPTYLAYSPLQLLHNVPLLGYNGIGKLKVGSQLFGHNSQNIRVDSLQTYPVRHTDEFLYDVILEPDQTSGTFEYFAGDGRIFLNVASEISTLRHSTDTEHLAFHAMKEMIHMASGALKDMLNDSEYGIFLNRLHKVSRRLEAHILTYTQIYQQTIKPQKKAIKSSAVETILDSVGTFTGDGTHYDLATGTAYAFFTRKLFNQMASWLKLGFRTIPEFSHGDTLAVSLLDLQVIASSSPLPLNPNITVQVEGHFSGHVKAEGSWTPFGGRIHKILYIPVNRLEEGYHVIKFHIRSPDDGTVHLTASRHFLLPLRHSYHYFRLPLFSADDKELGFINVDMRALSTRHIVDEEAGAGRWNENDQENLAHLIGRGGGELLTAFCREFLVKSQSK